MIATLLAAALIVLTPPPEYHAADTRVETFPLPGPPGLTTVEEFKSWNASGGRSVYLFYWTPSARDLGPMAVTAEWPARVAGQNTKIIETSIFMGRQVRAFVVHLSFRSPNGQAMIYAIGVNRAEFEKILAGVKRVN
jgi:hypothetical protein